MSEDFSNIHIESSLPKAWEEETTFNDVLYDWMGRAPWLAIALVLHLIALALLAVIPWHIFDKAEEKSVNAALEAPVEEITEEPEEEIEEEIEEEEPLDEPVLKDAEVSDHDETDDNQDFMMSEGDPDFLSDSPFDSDNTNDVIGIGGGAGGKFGGRFGGRRDLRRAGGSGTEQALRDGLEWLAKHQDNDGKWDADEFMKHDPAIDICEGPGRADHDVGVTGLAMLAFLGDGHTTRQGLYKNKVSKAVKWMREQQDFEDGLIGERVNMNFLYDHSIATLAMCEAYYFSKSPILASSAQKAVGYISQARNPYSVWRYAVPPNGLNDTSVTGWMIFAMKSAEEGGLKVDTAAFTDAITWFDEVTDRVTGRVGYSSVGEQSSRETGVNDEYPRELTEAMTAVGLLCRFFLKQEPSTENIMTKHADLMLKTLPEWDDENGYSNDLYYWYYGSYAMYQMGGKHWKAWNGAMKTAILGSQESTGSAKGSWDPNGPWGMVGGRVYSTALAVLCLEVYFRYARVLGAR